MKKFGLLWNTMFAFFMFGASVYILLNMPSEPGFERIERYVQFYGSLMIGWFLLVLNRLDKSEKS